MWNVDLQNGNVNKMEINRLWFMNIGLILWKSKGIYILSKDGFILKEGFLTIKSSDLNVFNSISYN